MLRSSKAVLIFLLVLFLFSSSLSAQAEGESSLNLDDSLFLYIGSPEAYVNGEKKALDPENQKVTPLIKDERTLVPVRFISEQLGAKVKWFEADSTIAIQKDDVHIHMGIGYAVMEVNGELIDLDTEPQLIQDRTYLPLRAIAEALHMKVTWYDGLIALGERELDVATNKPQFDQVIASLAPPKLPDGPVMIDTDGPGTVLLHGGYVYQNDGFNSGGKLYKFKYGQESQKQLLANESTTELNIQGDWIYYVVPTSMGSYGGTNPIRKMKTDGTQRQTVSQDKEVTEMVVSGGWIYYTSYDYSNWKVALYKVRTDGTGKQKLYEGYEDFAEVPASKKGIPSDIQIADNHVYLLIKKECGYSKACSNIYRMNTDGSLLTAVNSKEYAVSMQIANGNVYYSRFPEQLRDDSADSVSIELYTMTLDGKNIQAIPSSFDENSLYFIENFKVLGNWIYFEIWGELYKMKIDGSSLAQLVEGSGVQGFDIVGEWVYYRTKSNAYRIKTNGTQNEMLAWG